MSFRQLHLNILHYIFTQITPYTEKISTGGKTEIGVKY